MASDKYISEGQKIANCPFCRGVIFQDFIVDDSGSMHLVMRCPHCQQDLEIIVEDDHVTIGKKGEGENRH